jgi:hypothetical protein
MKKFDLSFDFKAHHYDAAIRVQQRDVGREFAITVLDWNLERLLYDNHIIREADGMLQANVLPGKKDQTELKLIIASRLSEYLKIPCFVGEQCLMVNPHEESWEELHPISRHEHDPQNGSF